MEGKIRRKIDTRAFGFIEDSSGAQYFFHKNDLISPPFGELFEGDWVSFTAGESHKGKVATQVKKINAPKEEAPKEVESKEETLSSES